MSLPVREREKFLAEPRIATLAVRREGDAGPFTVPIWYHYEPGGEPWIVTYQKSRKSRLIELAGRFTLMVERVEPTLRHVSVEGPAEREDATWEQLRGIATRYMGEEGGRRFVEENWSSPEGQVLYRLRPERWVGQDVGALPGMRVAR